MATLRKIQTPAKRGTLRVAEIRKAITDIVIPPEEIARRAFERFAARGYVSGFEQQDWLDAEEELLAEYRERQ